MISEFETFIKRESSFIFVIKFEEKNEYVGVHASKQMDD